MILQNIIAGVAVLGIGAIGNGLRRWARRIESRLGNIEKLLDINGRSSFYAD